MAQLTVFSGRGILSESAGPVWMIGTASEHHTMYQYSLVGAKDHWMGFIQTETVSNHTSLESGDLTLPCSLIISPSHFPQPPFAPIVSTTTQPSAVISTQHGAFMCKKAQTSQSSVRPLHTCTHLCIQNPLCLVGAGHYS